MAKISIEDRLAIEQLVTEYAWLLDHRRWDDVAGLCTEDAILFTPDGWRFRRRRLVPIDRS